MHYSKIVTTALSHIVYKVTRCSQKLYVYEDGNDPPSAYTGYIMGRKSVGVSGSMVVLEKNYVYI